MAHGKIVNSIVNLIKFGIPTPSPWELADKFDVTENYVRTIWGRRCPEIPRPRRISSTVPTPGTVTEAILEALTSGKFKTKSEIAKALGTSASMVTQTEMRYMKGGKSRAEIFQEFEADKAQKLEAARQEQQARQAQREAEYRSSPPVIEVHPEFYDNAPPWIQDALQVMKDRALTPEAYQDAWDDEDVLPHCMRCATQSLVYYGSEGVRALVDRAGERFECYPSWVGNGSYPHGYEIVDGPAPGDEMRTPEEWEVYLKECERDGVNPYKNDDAAAKRRGR